MNEDFNKSDVNPSSGPTVPPLPSAKIPEKLVTPTFTTTPPTGPGSGFTAVPDAPVVAATEVPKESLLSRITPKFKFSIPKEQALIPAVIIVGVLLLGGGGTYLIASNVLGSNDNGGEISSAPNTDLPSFDEALNAATPTLKLQVVTPSPEMVNFASPTPVATATANWTPYNFGTVYLNFSYPPGWFINVANTSGAPYLFVQNYSTSQTPPNTAGNYSIFIGRLTQVGMTTVAQLQTQLALNAASSTYLGTVNMGTTTVLTSTPTTINGYAALQRTITYSAFPSVQYYEVYVLDGVSNAIRFAPQLDIAGSTPYLNLLLSTVQFTN